MNKKGQSGIIFEGIMIIVFSVIFFLIVSLALFFNSSLENKQPLENLEGMHLKDSALNNIYVQSQTENLEGQNISGLVSKSKILFGKTISYCGDYSRIEDCDTDVVGLFPREDSCCKWKNDKCKNWSGDTCRLVKTPTEEKS